MFYNNLFLEGVLVMKRAYLHSIVSTMAVMAIFISPLYGQNKPTGSYVFQNFTLSDFGDGYDAAKKLVWKPKFSDYVVQAEGAEENQATEEQAATENAESSIPKALGGGNPDPVRNAVRYTEGKPDGVTALVGGSQKFILGVKAAFTKQGYNWIELHPHIATAQENDQAADPAAGNPDDAQENQEDQGRVRDQNSETILITTAGEVEAAPDPNIETEPFPIPFAGKAIDISIWVWGGHYGWWVEAYLRDYLGYQYRLPLGDLLYTGWRQKRSGIPKSVIQGRKRLPATQTLSFEMLKLWSFPTERVDNVYVYFDLLQHGSIVSTEIFNGKDLETLMW